MKLLRVTPNNTAHIYGLFGFVIMGCGLLLSGPGIYYQLQANNAPKTPIILPSAIAADTSKPEIKTGQPTELHISDIGVNLVVAKGEFDQATHTWNVSTDKAHYATVSDAPNNQYGNTFIYGHNRANVFARLAQLQPGAEATIRTDNNLEFVYRLSKVEETDPNNTSVLLPYSNKPTLSLQTCSGSWYQNRQIFRFDFVRVTNP
jgi:LPXTG-site transpeptidase (sortase) family protein